MVLSSLIHLQIPALARTERLVDDLGVLLGVSREEVRRRIEHPVSPRTVEFVAHVRRVARDRPHVLIAYAWVMYMAIFEGGLWVGEELGKARDGSWDLPDTTTSMSSSKLGISFWYFPTSSSANGDGDGEDIKLDFKHRLSDVASMLAPEHKADIIDEAKIIFELCAEMVMEMDPWDKDAEGVGVGDIGTGIEVYEKRDMHGWHEKWLMWQWIGWSELLPWLVRKFLVQLLLVFVYKVLWVRVWGMICGEGEGGTGE